jgi:ATP-dependent Lon protease
MNDSPMEETFKVPEVLPLLPVRDVVVFPYMILPLFVSRELSIGAVDAALMKDRLIMLAAQRNVAEDVPAPKDIYAVGTVAMIMRMLKLPDGRVKILVQGLTKARIQDFEQRTPIYKVHVTPISDRPVAAENVEIEAMMRAVREQLEKIVNLGKLLSSDVMMVVDSVTEPGRLADLVASNMTIKVSEAQAILEMDDPLDRLRTVNDLLTRELELLNVQTRIQTQAKEEISRSQREYFLREQLRAIREELGDKDSKESEAEEFAARLEAAGMPEPVRDEAKKQLDRLETMHADSAEANVIRTYLDWMVNLPWSRRSKDKIDIARAKKILDEDHYGLDKVKDRILEFLSVHKLKKKMRGPILCFVGPPGVGKTSLGRSIARAMGRQFIRVSLGGMRDEAEIRGHRRTYIGAMPGRIIQGIKQAGTANPVFMMDEIDKIGQDFRGDPSSALLEVLDPEQNYAFSDHYLNVPFDLSHVMFITTANLMDPIPSALKDRMEVIHLSGYTIEEKTKIARRYLIPRQLEENGIRAKDLQFTEDALESLIQGYTMEAGLRNLEREIASVCRKVARRIAEKAKTRAKVARADLPSFLGAPRFRKDDSFADAGVGIARGLAWTPYGGEVLQIETEVVKGSGKLSLTGQLGDVMKESAQAAITYARAHGEKMGIAPDFTAERDVHIHVPAGATPKDGPSAGVTMLSSLVSALTGRPVRKDIAMTGEITLTGRVLPVGGIREKVLAALREDVRELILPAQNASDFEEMPAHMRENVRVHFVRRADEVLELALGDLPARPEESEPEETLPPPYAGRGPRIERPAALG